MSDCLIVGGGIIGLSLAYDLAGHGLAVRVIDAGQPAREASWAGAGILPPANPASDDPLDQLTALSNDLHRQWSAELRDSTRIDNGYRRTGAIYLARSGADLPSLISLADQLRFGGIEAERLPPASMSQIEPALRPTGRMAAAYLVPDECQLRNPRHLKALLVACTERGVEIMPGVGADDFEIRRNRLRAVLTNRGPLSADIVCLTSGSWTAALAAKLGTRPAIKPVRGQMMLLALARPIVSRIINEGSRYLVPRDDGRLLVGSTEEDAGFDKSTTAGGMAGLLEFALGLVPDLAAAQIERSWAGLRPSTSDGLPYLGRVPELENAFIAAGHFRAGLQLSTGTAVVLSQLIRGLEPAIDISSFRVDRDASDARTASPRDAHEVPLN
jgi:glycine oxidase